MYRVYRHVDVIPESNLSAKHVRVLQAIIWPLMFLEFVTREDREASQCITDLLLSRAREHLFDEKWRYGMQCYSEFENRNNSIFVASATLRKDCANSIDPVYGAGFWLGLSLALSEHPNTFEACPKTTGMSLHVGCGVWYPWIWPVDRPTAVRVQNADVVKE